MESLANMVIALADLAEAEGRAAHRGVIRLSVRLAAIIGAALIGLIGLLLVSAGIYFALALWLGYIGAALICGAALLGLSVALYLYGRVPPRRPIDSKPIEIDEPAAHASDANEPVNQEPEGGRDDAPLRAHSSI